MEGTISWSDFEKIDIRVGTIIAVDDFPNAKKPAFQLTIDFGPEIGVRRSSAQLTHLYNKSLLLNKQILVVVNFPPKQIANFFSECLVLGLYGTDGEVIVVQADRSVANGLKLG